MSVAHLESTMRYLALATDFDGTLASHGQVDPLVLAGLQRLRDSGRRLLLVTGRVWPELQTVFPGHRVFHRIIAENGALSIDPETMEETPLAAPPPACFVERLRQLGVEPLSLGRVIVATCEPHQNAVLWAIRELGLELQVIFNKGAVMVLPSGVNKASGLVTALSQLGLSRHNCVGVGDAENDHALLEHSGLAVAVNNAVPMLKERADWVTRGREGDGVLELIEEWLEDGLVQRAPRRDGRVIVGKRAGGQTVTMPVHACRALLCGHSGSGKSTLTSALLEQLTEQDYQSCVVDPEGDFQTSSGRVTLGDAHHVPDLQEVIKALTATHANVVVNLLGVRLEERPAFLEGLMQQVREHQQRFGRPHWVVIDEAHHMLSRDMPVAPQEWHDATAGLLLVTVHPGRLHPRALEQIETVVIIGGGVRETLDELGRAEGLGFPRGPKYAGDAVEAGRGLVWRRSRPSELTEISLVEPREERRRHQRKYAIGELGHDKSFYFRGPHGALNLRAHNLTVFVQMAEGIDTDTWEYHLQRNDYSRWLREAVKDNELADEVQAIETRAPPFHESRALVRRAIDRRYTLPA